MYDYHTNSVPVPLRDFFTSNSAVHTHGTRQAFMPHRSCVNTNKLLKSFAHAGPKLWMEVPQNIRNNILHKKSFKRNIKKYLQSIVNTKP